MKRKKHKCETRRNMILFFEKHKCEARRQIYFLKTWMQSRRNIIMFFEKHKCKARRNTILFFDKHECKMRKQITSMKICLFTHWRWRVFQASECKNLYNNLKKIEDVMQWHEVASTSIQKNVKKMSNNVMKQCFDVTKP